MRSANFRDRVLFPLARKIGLDPGSSANSIFPVGFLQNQADSLASYATDWVRRLWDAQDWPEWTLTRPFSFPVVQGPNPEFQNTIEWLQLPDDFDPTQEAQPLIGTPLKVYLLDPYTTTFPVDTPYKLNPNGIFCGLEHGPTVWIKYRIRCPEFTATPWSSVQSYNLNDLTYSPISGECYLSLSSGNVGNDPSIQGFRHPLPPQTIQGYIPGTPGSPAQAKRIGIDFTHVDLPPKPPQDPTPLPIPCLEYVEIQDASNTIIGDSAQSIASTTLLSTLLTTIGTDLTGSLPGSFAVSVDTTAFQIILQDLSDFSVSQAYWEPGSVNPTHNFALRQIQPYIPAQAPTPPQLATISVTMSATDVLPGSTYFLNFLNSNGTHSASYLSLPTDGMTQIITGLFAAISAQTADSFFVALNLSVTGSTMTFKYAGDFSLDSYCTFAGSSIFWKPNYFPFALLDQTLRGSLADNMREQGQTDKADAEETKVPAEEQSRTASYDSPQYDPLTDQQKPKSRYQVK